MKQKLIDFYLDWVNNFLTVAGMAQYYGVTYEEAVYLIEVGRKYHEEKVAHYKLTYTDTKQQ